MSTKTLDRTVKAGRVYEADLYGWVEDQVALLKAGDVGSIDASHITRELEDLGRSEFNKLVGALRGVLLHLLKWDYQPERRSRSWVLTIYAQRERIADELEDSPSLKPRLQEALQKAYARGLRDAERETGLPLSVFPDVCPYEWHDVIQRPVHLDDNPS
jgi:hypothetical protein